MLTDSVGQKFRNATVGMVFLCSLKNSELLSGLPSGVCAREISPFEDSGGGGLIAKSYLILVTPWIVAHQAPLSMGFPRQEYWSRLPPAASKNNNFFKSLNYKELSHISRGPDTRQLQGWLIWWLSSSIRDPGAFHFSALPSLAWWLIFKKLSAQLKDDCSSPRCQHATEEDIFYSVSWLAGS